jgi:V/A-type H+-transporting ATPase subunit B
MTLAREGYRTVSSIEGPLLFVQGVVEAGYGELVTIECSDGYKQGQILQVDGDIALIQIYEGTTGLDRHDVTVWLDRDIIRVPVGLGMKGKIFNGRGKPLDGKPFSLVEDYRPVYGSAINPAARKSPNNFIETGISTIDMMNTLVRGQKLPVFAGPGLPANELAAHLVEYATIPGRESSFLVIFAAMGITAREADYFTSTFERSGAINHGVFFLNLASDSAVERILTPRMALTVAEYYAFEKDYDVLVVLTDMLYYCESLREISAAREEVPGRRGFPGYLYSDLSEIYERAGCVRSKKGSITQIPVITMPGDDMTHPVIDLSGYITEGQIVLDRDLFAKTGFPPVNVLPSLSRLMNKGIGPGRTFDYHRQMADQLYASYAKSIELFRLKSIVGDEGLTETEHKYLKFGEQFEILFVKQGYTRRSIKESLSIAWKCLEELPEKELYRIPEKYLFSD